MIKLVRNITIPFVITFFASSQTMAGYSYDCKMTTNGGRVCGSEEKLALISKISSSWSDK
jgi:hypothetical protein